jgi:hypothetical protein
MILLPAEIGQNAKKKVKNRKKKKSEKGEKGGKKREVKKKERKKSKPGNFRRGKRVLSHRNRPLKAINSPKAGKWGKVQGAKMTKLRKV